MYIWILDWHLKVSLHFIECIFASIGSGGSVGKRIWARALTPWWLQL
jgi:hypothetical protein